MQGRRGSPGSFTQGPAASAKGLQGPPQLQRSERRNGEDPKNFPDAWITSVIRKGQGSEGIMKMLGEANKLQYHL